MASSRVMQNYFHITSQHTAFKEGECGTRDLFMSSSQELMRFNGMSITRLSFERAGTVHLSADKWLFTRNLRKNSLFYWWPGRCLWSRIFQSPTVEQGASQNPQCDTRPYSERAQLTWRWPEPYVPPALLTLYILLVLVRSEKLCSLHSV